MKLRTLVPVLALTPVLGFVSACSGNQEAHEALILARENQASIDQLLAKLEKGNGRGVLREAPTSGNVALDIENQLIDGLEAARKRDEELNKGLDALNARLHAMEEARLTNSSGASRPESGKSSTNPTGILDGGPASPDKDLTGNTLGKLPDSVKEMEIVGDDSGRDVDIIGEDSGGDSVSGDDEKKWKEDRNRKMGVDESTAQRLEEIEKSYHDKKVKLTSQFMKGALTKDQFYEQKKMLRDASDAEAAMVLTPDQKKIYDKHNGVGGCNRHAMVFEVK